MKNDTGILNELWSRLIIKELIHHGVRTFCISPGSRSTPLMVAADRHPLAETFIHFDERGMAYHALGYAKGSHQPVALIVTSGTAVGNLLPAIMEAHHDQIPLIVLSADRPPELRDAGANQTTDQVKIFSNFVNWQGDLPCPDSKIPQSYIGTTIAQMIHRALSYPLGPVHLNCMFRKPFLIPEGSTQMPLHQANRFVHSTQTTLLSGTSFLDKTTFEWIADELSGIEKGLILTHGEVDTESLYTLSRNLQWPIFPDLFSCIRSNGAGYGVIPYYDLILKALGAHEDYTPEAILQIGDRFVSSKLTDWIASKKPKIHCHIAPHSDRKDPIHSITHRISTDLNHFLEHFPKHLPGRPPSKWFDTWKELNRLIKKGIHSYFLEHQDLSEPLLFHTLSTHIPSRATLFFSNSMNARNGDAFFVPESPVGPIFGNRGLSGIDGNIATVAGIARGSGKEVIAFLGDLAYLHDLNSLPLIQKLSIKLIIVNNQGGDIFNFLPTGEKKELFITPHTFSLKHSADLFQLPYENPKNSSDLLSLLNESGPLLIEINTSQGQSLKLHQDLLSILQEIPSRVISSLSY